LPSGIRSSELVARDPQALVRLLDESRPPPVSLSVRDAVLAGLPRKGQVHDLDSSERRKLAALAPVLAAAQRESAYVVTVIDVPEAFVGLHDRSVLLIARPALRVMSEGELRGIVAHEAGHEYVHAEYQSAMAAGRRDRLQDLELVCDIIAVVILRAIGQEAWSLPAAIAKIETFNRARFGLEAGHPDYPPLLLRRSTILSLEKRFARSIPGR
jgi:hypothetical protein